MKIIDRETGKRLKKIDPVKGNPIKDDEISNQEHSPMAPPDAYVKSTVEVEKETSTESLNILMKEHERAIEVIQNFEISLAEFKENNYRLNEQINNVFKTFFEFFDSNLLPHNRKEEKYLFPLLQKKLIENGEHSTGEDLITAIDLMEDDHVKFIQLGALVFNLLGLASRFKDEQSSMFTYDVAYNNAKELIELIRLHIFREDNTLFPLALKYITKNEFEVILNDMHNFAIQQNAISETLNEDTHSHL